MARRPGLSLRRLERIVDGFSQLRLLVVGDAMLASALNAGIITLTRGTSV